MENPYIPQQPTLKQAEFLLSQNEEVMFGGAGGPGKSSGLLMAALQYVDVPGYAAILMRRSYASLMKPGALISRSFQWLKNTPAVWDGQYKMWRFPSGAILDFGYLDSEIDKYNYDSAEYHFIGIDELTQWPEDFYTFMFQRKRRLENSQVPVRVRSATNPGREGHVWVKDRFITNPTYVDPIDGSIKTRLFIPAKLDDNPHIDREEYIRSLMQLDPISREQILNGDWNVRHEGMKFKREWFQFTDKWPEGRMVRFWDLAATAPKKGNRDPDYTVGTLMCEKQGQFWIIDVKRDRLTAYDVDNLLQKTAAQDGRAVTVYIEEEPGASGKRDAARLKREVMMGYACQTIRSTGSKEIRANALASAAEAGNVFMVHAPWNDDVLEEFELFPSGAHDDCVDSGTGAFNALTGNVVTKESIKWL